MREEVLHQVGWMKEFRFTKYESTCIKLAMVRNGSDIAYMSPSREVFWHREMLLSWLKMAPQLSSQVKEAKSK